MLPRGEDEPPAARLGGVAPFYSPRERAALAWSEALMLLPQTGAPDDVFAVVDAEFSARRSP
jgi:alkylhydroperoxidase family enzyme